MTDADRPTAEHNPLWSWSLERYARPGVAETAIALQDQGGANVNLLLLCVWAGDEAGLALTEAQIATIGGTLKTWSQGVTGPLRGVRRILKSGPEAGRPGAHSLRERVKALELAAERIEQDILYDTVRAQTLLALEGSGDQARRAGPEPGPDLGEVNTRRYLALLPVEDAEIRRAIEINAKAFLKALRF